MRVLLANKYFHARGGAETVFFQEREHLIRNGWQVADFSMAHPDNIASEFSGYFLPWIDYGDPATAGGGSIGQRIRASASFIHNRQAVDRVRSLVSAFRPEVAHVHNIYHQLTPSILPAIRACGAPTAVTLHDFKVVCPSYLMTAHGHVCEKCRGRRFYQAMLTKCKDGSAAKGALLAAESYWHRFMKNWENADLFIAPSRFLAKRVRAWRPELTPIAVVPNGVDTATWRPDRKGEGYILYAGRLSPEKGVDVLLKAIRRMKRPVPLVVAGDGPLSGPLQQRYPEVRFLGRLSGREFTGVVESSDTVVVPSVCHENCSMAVLEAMAAGRPVVATTLGGLPEQVENDRTGLLVPPGDPDALARALDELAASKTLRAEMGKSGRIRVEERFSLDRNLEHITGLLRALATGRGAGASDFMEQDGK